MEQRRAGRSGLRLSRLALGTMTWGRDTDEHEAHDQLRAYLDAGGTTLDTAGSYGDGESESLIGALLGRVVPREEIVLVVKSGVATRGGDRVVDTSRGALLASLDASLRRLDVDDVDLWQVQAWSPDTPADEVLSALDTAVTSGRARYAGVANWSGWQTGWAVAWQQAWPGRAPLAATQVEYSLVQRGVEREVLPLAAAHGLGVIAWSPLGRGVLTGKYRGGTPADSRLASPHFERFVAAHLGERSRGVVDAVATAASGLGVAPLEVALAWVRDRPGVTSAVVGARTAAQLRGSLEAEDLELPDEIRSALDDVSRPGSGYPDRPVAVEEAG